MCTFSGGQSCFQCFYMQSLRSYWRRKWYALIGLLVFVSIILLIVWQSVSSLERNLKDTKRDTYIDNVVHEVYQDGIKWFNRKNLTPTSLEWNRYIAEIRRDWIIWKHDPRRSYNLEDSKVEDHSMGQTSVIRKILEDKKNGFFVECGAYDGETRSNTLFLERFLNWSGLLIEADPINFSKMLEKNRRAYLTPTCLSVRPYPTVSSFLMAKNVGRLHEPNASDNHLPNSPDVAHSGVHISVQCFPFMHYMIALNITTVNYFSLDIEGYELQVLKTIPFDQINIETLSVEFSHVEGGRKEMIDFMVSKGYYVYSFVVRTDKLAHDVIFVKYDFEELASIK